MSAIKLARAGLRTPDKPIGSFLFSGPTGVGRTELAAHSKSIGFGTAETASDGSKAKQAVERVFRPSSATGSMDGSFSAAFHGR